MNQFRLYNLPFFSNFQSYLRYSFIWAEDRTEQVKHFVNSEPITQEIKEKIVEYENLTSAVKNLPTCHVIGPIQIDMGMHALS